MISKSLLINKFIAQKPINTADGMGGFTRSWSDQFYFQGRLSTISISESLSADKATVFMTHKVYCDYNDKFDATWRIALDGTSRTFEIKGVGLPSNQTMGHMELQVKEQV